MSRLGLIVVLNLVLGLPGWVEAHGISGQCHVRGGKVIVEAYFETEEPAADAKVAVMAKDGREIATGRTDEAGVWTFAHPGPGEFDVQLDAGAGHQHVMHLTLHEPSADEEQRVSSGPPRSAFTGFRFGKIAAGLTVIVVAALLLRWLLRRGRTATTPALQ